MADLVGTHPFVSTKPDSPDGSLASSSEWNAAHVFTGGSHGQSIVRSGSSATGIATIDATAANNTSGAHSGSSPSPDLATQNITFSSPGFILLFPNILGVVSDSSNISVSVKRDGVTIASYSVQGTGINNTRCVAQAEVVGGHTYTVACSLGSGTFTSLNVGLVSLKLGTL